MLPELLCVKPKKYLDRSEFDSWISREKRCIRLMEAGKYKELEEYLQQLDEEMKGKEKNNRDVFVNDILEKALQGQDEKAVDILLQFVRMISPVSYISQKLITDDPILFRKLAKSRKLDWSPYHVMEVKLSKRIYEKRSFTGNLMEILIVLHKADLVQILLEEGYSYRSYERTKRDRSLDNGKEYSDFFMENTMKSNVCENLLELAISVCDIEITKIFMEQGKYDFSTEKYKMEKRKNKQEAFFVWMMEEYPERLIEKLKLEWMLRQCGPYQYKDKVFAFYVEKKGLEVLLEELKESLSAVIKNQVVFGSDQSVFFVLNVIETIRKQKKMAKTTEDKEKINKTEQECFTMLRNAKNLNQYPMWFFITADYWYRKEKMLAKDMAEILFFIYFYWDETMLEENWFGYWQSCLSKKELKEYTKITLESMNSMIEEGKMEPCGYFISLELEEERPNRKRIGRVMDRVNPELNQTIEQTDNRASFLAFLLLQDSPVLVEKAWKKGFLTERNLQDAVQFAVDNDKKEILPSLYQCIGKCDNKPDSYML